MLLARVAARRAGGSSSSSSSRCLFTSSCRRSRQQDEGSRPRQQAYEYYVILGIPRTARVVDIKHSYFRLAKQYHPDMVQQQVRKGRITEQEAKNKEEEFNRITEAYSCLTDVTQRHFYDLHGFSCEQLKNKGMPSIFDYQPSYPLYSERMSSDRTTTAMEDWFRAQGHSMADPKITLRQRLKNMYVEFRWGLFYYDFPWNWPSLFRGLCYLAAALTCVVVGLTLGIDYVDRRLPAGHPLKTKRINDMMKRDDDDEWLDFKPPKKPSEYKDNLESNTKRGRLSRNLERHARRKAEAEERERKAAEARKEHLRREREELKRQMRMLERQIELEDEREEEKKEKKRKN